MRSRSAHSLPLVRYYLIHCVGRGCAPFSSARSFAVPSGEDGGDDGVAVLRSVPRPVLRPVFSFRLYVHCSLFICVVASRRRRRFPSPRLSRASPRQILRPSCSLSIPSRSSPRLASRRPSRCPLRSYLVLSCPMCRTLAARLTAAPFCSAHLAVLSMPYHPRRPITGCRRARTDAA